jgi:predicted ribonuclease YlaK
MLLLCHQAVLFELDAQKGNLLLGYSAREATKLLERLQKFSCRVECIVDPTTTSSSSTTTSSSSKSSISIPLYRGQAQHEVHQNNEEKLAKAFARMLGDDQATGYGYAPVYTYGGDYNIAGCPTASVSCMGRMTSWFGGQQQWPTGGNVHAVRASRCGGAESRGFGIFQSLRRQDQRKLFKEVQRMMGGALRGDDGIVDCMLYFQSRGRRVTLVTNDKLLRLRAVTEGVSIADMREWRAVVADYAAATAAHR